MSKLEFRSHFFLDNKVNSRKVVALWKFFSSVLPKNIQDTDDKQNPQYFILHIYINNYLFMYLTVIFGPTFHSLKIFKLQLLYMCIYVCVGGCWHATSWEWRSGDSFEVWVLIFSFVGPGAGAQAWQQVPSLTEPGFSFRPLFFGFTSTCALISFPCGIFCSSIISSLTGLLLSAPRFQFIPLHLTTQPTCNLRSPPCHRQIKSGGGKLSGCDWLGL